MKPFDIAKAFSNYRSVIFKIDTDLNFWKSFLGVSIKNYQSKISKPDEIYSACFSVYNIDIRSNEGILTPFKDLVSIRTVDLEEHKSMFFSWILNLSILKSYNAMEIFLLQAIWLKYYPILKNPISDRNGFPLQREIKKELNDLGLKTDTKNNRYLIEFLKNKSKNFDEFLKQPIRIDLTTTWENYFELLSILRNVFAHQGTVITQDTLNAIKSKSRDIFERLFTIKNDISGDMHLHLNGNGMSTLITLLNDFSANSVKFFYGHNDFKFMT